MYFPQLFFFSIILSLWIIKIVFFYDFLNDFKKAIDYTNGIFKYIWYRMKIKIK